MQHKITGVEIVGEDRASGIVNELLAARPDLSCMRCSSKRGSFTNDDALLANVNIDIAAARLCTPS